MFGVYFKQAIEILKQTRFISIVTITGTALAIMMVMVIIVTESVKHISIAPESNRYRTMYIKNTFSNNKNSEWVMNGRVQYDKYKNYLSDLKTPEAISAINAWENKKCMIKMSDREEHIQANVREVDGAYWKIMEFTFIGGKPFTQEDFNSGIHNAVISENLANRIFANVNVTGRDIEINFKQYKITGVVKDASEAFKFAHGEVYIPYTTNKGYESQGYNILYLVKDKSDMAILEKEVRAAEQKHNNIDPEWDITFFGPYNHRLQVLNKMMSEEPDEKKAYRKMISIFAIMLLIPAVNLSSLSMSRVMRRTEEIGIRKAFGARKYIILVQVLFENFITSLIGGIIGLALSYLMVIYMKEWLLDVGAGSSIPVSALISFPVFAGVFLVCFFLNLLSAGIPAYRASRTVIMDSIHKRNN